MLTTIAQLSPSTSSAAVYGYEVLLGFGAGMGLQAGFAVIQAITKPELMTHGLGFIMIGKNGKHLSVLELG